MQKWSCHTEVEAFKVTSIIAPFKAGFNCILVGADGEMEHVTSEWVEKHDHHIDVYFVRNLETGEASYMSAEEFEAKYSVSLAVECDAAGVVLSEEGRVEVESAAAECLLRMAEESLPPHTFEAFRGILDPLCLARGISHGG